MTLLANLFNSGGNPVLAGIMQGIQWVEKSTGIAVNVMPTTPPSEYESYAEGMGDAFRLAALIGGAYVGYRLLKKVTE